MKLLDVCQLKAVGGGKMDQDGNPIYDDWYPGGSDGMFPGFELVSPEEGTGPRPDSNMTTGQTVALTVTTSAVVLATVATAVLATTPPGLLASAVWASGTVAAAASATANGIK